MNQRAAGVLLHPTSLPGRFGIGDLGPEVDRFLDWAHQAGQSWWQVLPLGPADGASPYNSLSAFAGNPLLISPELLVERGWLVATELEDSPSFSTQQVDFDRVAVWKNRLLHSAWQRFQSQASSADQEQLQGFLGSNDWLDDWTLFAALRARYDGQGWWQWPPELAQREAAAMASARQSEAAEAAYQGFVQWLFHEQWQRVRSEAAARNLGILGDVPIYVSWNSAEVWAHPHLFELDERGMPLAVAGCPPDAYSDTGQLWGNPLYRWDRMAEDGFRWWLDRMQAALATCDRLRLDHFRGFAGYWSIPAEAENAVDGHWEDGPGMALFEALREALGELPLIAEDLGVITPDVDELRRNIGLPGQKVLQFAFEDPVSVHLPHNFEPASVVYTSTHDSDTTRGWFETLAPDIRQRIESYTGSTPEQMVDAFIRLAYTSVAELAIVPIQDVLGLGTEGRMNVPGTVEDNWRWRLEAEHLDAEHAERLRTIVEVSGRLGAA
ncbi:MAG: 4-alpha-glucanotransferase [Acidobacteriota bacterium]